MLPACMHCLCLHIYLPACLACLYMHACMHLYLPAICLAPFLGSLLNHNLLNQANIYTLYSLSHLHYKTFYSLPFLTLSFSLSFSPTTILKFERREEEEERTCLPYSYTLPCLWQLGGTGQTRDKVGEVKKDWRKGMVVAGGLLSITSSLPSDETQKLYRQWRRRKSSSAWHGGMATGEPWDAHGTYKLSLPEQN